MELLVTIISSGAAGTIATWVAGRVITARRTAVREEATDAAKAFFREAIKAELAEFKSDFMATLNGTYVRSQGATVTGAEIQRRLESVERRVE